MIVDALRRHDKEESRLWMIRHAKDWRRGYERAGKDLDQPVERIYLQHITMDAGR